MLFWSSPDCFLSLLFPSSSSWRISPSQTTALTCRIHRAADGCPCSPSSTPEPKGALTSSPKHQIFFQLLLDLCRFVHIFTNNLWWTVLQIRFMSAFVLQASGEALRAAVSLHHSAGRARGPGGQTPSHGDRCRGPYQPHPSHCWGYRAAHAPHCTGQLKSHCWSQKGGALLF